MMQSSGEENLKLVRHDIEILQQNLDEPVDIDFLSGLRQVNANSPTFKMPCGVIRDVAPFSYNASDEELLLFSGGKVSLATAIRLRDMHKNVILYHVEESKKLTSRIYEIADMLKLPLVVHVPEKERKNDFKGLYSGMMLCQDAIENTVYNGMSPRVYMGYFYMASIQHNIDSDWRYCTELIGAYNNVIGKYIRGAEIVGMLPNYSTVDDEFNKYREFKKFLA